MTVFAANPGLSCCHIFFPSPGTPRTPSASVLTALDSDFSINAETAANAKRIKEKGIYLQILSTVDFQK